MTTKAARGVLSYVLVLLFAVGLIDCALCIAIANQPVTNWTITAMVFAVMAALFLLYCVFSVVINLIRMWGQL